MNEGKIKGTYYYCWKVGRGVGVGGQQKQVWELLINL